MAYDAIVVGARCAGAPLGMLLARQGHRVLIVDADRLPSDMPLSTHLIWQSGAARLKRWGLLDAVAASGCPPIKKFGADLGPVVLNGTPPAEDGIAHAFSPRRFVLDKILLDAASASGAELRSRFRVTDLLYDGERVTGIRGMSNRAPVEEYAQIVIGADGRGSRVSQRVKAANYNAKPRLEGTFFTYWRDVSIDGLEFYVRPHRGIYAWPTNDGLSLVGVNWAAADFGPVKADIERHYLDVVAACAPSLRERLREGTRVGRFIGGSIANFLRKPHGPGWALVGDAGLTVDPCTAAGINDAFRDVELLAAAIDDGLSGRRPMDGALADYQAQRDAAALPIYEFTCQLAQFAPPTPEMAQLFGALATSQPDTDRFFGLFAQTVSPADFFAPDNVAQIVRSATDGHAV